jgi:hypothetical protein
VREDAGAKTVGVVRSGDTTSLVSVLFTAGEGTAQAGSDFAAATSPIQFDPGEISQTVPVQVLNDDQAEGNETVFLSLNNPAGGGGATLGRRAIADLLIADDDDSWQRLRIRRRT